MPGFLADPAGADVMAEPRLWRFDVPGFTLSLLGAVFGCALLSHHPADHPEVVYPAHDAAQNLFGAPGAWFSHTLLDGFGGMAYGFVAAWLALAGMLFVRRSWLRWLQRLCGACVLLPAGAAALALGELALPDQPVTGGGGSVGASLANGLADTLGDAGAWCAVAALVGLGLALAADRPAAWLAVGGVRAVRRLLAAVRTGLLSRAARRVPKTVRKRPAPAKTPDDDADAIPIRHHAEVPVAPGGAAAGDCYDGYELPALDLLDDAVPVEVPDLARQLRDRAALLEKTFADFGLTVKVVGINTGPVVTQFEIALETGLRVNKVTRLTDDLALNLRVPSVRMVAPIPGKNTVGVEIPNEVRADVRLKEVFLGANGRVAKCKLPLFLGKDTEGRPLVHDLAEMPHLLIAGRTGTGKSVCLNALILSLLMTRRPDEVKMILIDPKFTEFTEFAKIPHLMHPVVKDAKKAEAILAWAVDKMEERYDLLSRARVRNITGYNALSYGEILRRVAPETDEERQQIPERMPYIVLIVDEMGDLMMQLKKEVEGHIIRLSQKSRAAGIHLIVATQKPTVDVITGLIKSNLPARICFKVVNKSDSRVVLDEMGADKLLGKGDLLFLPPGASSLIRGQGAYASDEEIQRVVGFLECEPNFAAELINLEHSRRDGDGGPMGRLKERDPLYEQAIEIVIREGRGSVSLLQRAMGIGYGRSARLIDYMAEDGIVGAYNGSNAREVRYTPEQWAEMRGAGAQG